MNVNAILAIGSNVGDRFSNIINALKRIDGACRVQSVSSIYESEALLLENSPSEWNLPFYNLVIEIKTAFSPLDLLAFCKDIEKNLGSNHHERWAPREIDIDIIWYNGMIILRDDLQIPHKETCNRDFVLIPLQELNHHSVVIDKSVLKNATLRKVYDKDFWHCKP